MQSFHEITRRKERKRKNLKPTCFAGGTSPSRHAGLIAVAVAFVVAEHVVPRPAEFRARGVVVVGLALNPHAVSETQIAVDSRSFVSQRVPISARLQNARINGSFNFTWNFTKNKTNKTKIKIKFKFKTTKRVYTTSHQWIHHHPKYISNKKWNHRFRDIYIMTGVDHLTNRRNPFPFFLMA